ncbi:MAG TPA: CAP domain-containing protein [Actinomycetota bacterium]
MDRVRAGDRRLAGVALALLIVLLAQGVSADRASASTDLRRRSYMLSLTNDDRAQHDKAVLRMNAVLSRYATDHSRQMATRGYLFHTADLSSKLKGLDWSIGGENVGVGSTLDGVEGAFMGSTPHRRNILRTGFDHAAVGVIRSNGSFWVTVIFYG